MNNHLPKRVLICGLGSIGRRYCRLINKTWPSIQLAAFRSPYPRQCVEEMFLTHTFSHYNDALAWRPDAAVIATPASKHIEQALQLAEHGIPLLIEKPIGTGLEELGLCNQLLAFAEAVPIYVGYVLRHDPCAAFVREQLTSDQLGHLVSADFFCGSWLPDWRSGQDYRQSVSARRELGGGALLELSHELDMAQWLLGPLTPLHACLRNTGLLDINVEDQAFMLAQNPGGTSVSFRLDFCTNPARRMISLRFAHGELVWDLLEGTVSKSAGPQQASIHQLGFTPDERFCCQLKLFWQCPAPRETSLCSLREGIDVLNLIASARNLSAV